MMVLALAALGGMVWYLRPHQKISDTWANSIGTKLAYIPAGEFEMGSPPAEIGRQDNETLHHVKITKPFMMATTPVTRRQWKVVMGVDPRGPGNSSDNLPAVMITWNEAVDFCRRLSEKGGCSHYRLPTEAEWEYACRAGTTTPFGGTGNLDEMGWYRENSGDRIHPLGEKKPNAWGLYDMHGSVYQWCSDGYVGSTAHSFVRQAS